MDSTDHVKFSTIVKIVTDVVNDSSIEMKSTRIGLFEEMIKLKIINADDALSVSMSKTKTKMDVGLIAVCLRNGANPNLYMNVKSLGPAHILVYAYTVLSKQLFELVYYLLILGGASTSLPSYDSGAPNIVHFDKGPLKQSNIKMESVYDWLCNRDKNNKELKSVASDVIDHIKSHDFKEQDRQILSVYLDEEDLCNTHHHHHHHKPIIKWSSNMMTYLLCSRNPNWHKVDPSSNSKHPSEQSQDQMSSNTTQLQAFLKIAVNATFFEMVDDMLNSGIKPTYTDFVFWIAHYKQISSIINDDFLIKQCEKMFISLIQRGYQIDMYCLDEIGSINPEFRVTLIEEYQRPLWEKVCSFRADDFVPDSLKMVSIYLGLPQDSSKDDFCNAVENITLADFESLKIGNRRRNSEAIGSKLNFLADFVGGSGCATCDNFSSFEDNPLDYPEKMLAYYKSRDGRIWCFLSKDFESLVRNGTNPSTREKLPIEFIEQIKSQINVLNYFGIPLSDSKPLDRILSDVRKPDYPTNTQTDLKVNSIKELLSTRGITEEKIMHRFKISELIARFNHIGVEIMNIIMLYDEDLNKTLDTANGDLSPRMMFNLICITLYDEMKKDTHTFDKFTK